VGLQQIDELAGREPRLVDTRLVDTRLVDTRLVDNDASVLRLRSRL
jgi:hypothetical protein